MTYEIPVTQYLLPDGRRRQETYKTEDADLNQKAQNIINRGWRFEVEILRTGDVSLTVTDPDEDGFDIEIEVFKNEPGKADDAMKAVIARAHARIAA
jgi:hypothetical protein